MKEFIIFIMFATLVGTVYYNRQMSKKLEDRDQILSREEQRLARLEEEAGRGRDRDEAELKSDQAALQHMQTQLSQLQSAADALSARLVQAKNMATGGRQVTSAQWDIGQEKKTIADLQAQIKYIDDTRKSYKESVNMTTQQQKLDHDRNLAAINEQIGLQNITVSQMNTQSQTAKNRLNGPVRRQTTKAPT